MAVGLDKISQLNPVDGISLSVSKAGIKYSDRYDLTLIEICEGAQVVGVFTQNQFCAAPVIIAKRHLVQTTPRFLVINTGNANAGTGEQGLEDALQICEQVASLAGVELTSVLPFSTGVIGENLPTHRIVSALPDAVNNTGMDDWVLAAEGIMTTDTLPKGVSRSFECNGESVTITGIAKGSGMIRPNMATLLAFVATDAEVEKSILQDMLQRANAASFNSITVDSDTSTNDACMLIATGQGGLKISAETPVSVLDVFYENLLEVLQTLAKNLVRDAEGATKFIAVTVKNGIDEAECRQIAYTIAHSPLVKTAFFASDPNWGRILAAIGRVDIVDLDVSKLKIYLDDICIAENGSRSPSYTEEKGQAVMDKQDIEIVIDLTRGNISHTIWTSDLSYEYIKINAEYRT